MMGSSLGLLTPKFFPACFMGVLNNNEVQGQTCPGLDDSSKAPGRSKKVRPARPQPFLRAERTLST
jgi:hypothetical protein